MGSDIALPFYTYSLNTGDFEELIDEIWPPLPGEKPNVIKALKYLGLGSGGRLSQNLELLMEAIESTDILDKEKPQFKLAWARLGWLKRDLALAPLLISEPLRVNVDNFDGVRRYEKNIRVVVRGAGFEWESYGYLLGVLLSELNRLESVPVEVIGRIDATGVLDLSETELDDPVGSVGRTVDSIVASDQDRDFSNCYSSVSEDRSFIELQTILSSQR